MQQNDPRNLNNKRPMNQSFITGSNLTPVPEKKFAGIGMIVFILIAIKLLLFIVISFIFRKYFYIN